MSREIIKRMCLPMRERSSTRFPEVQHKLDLVNHVKLIQNKIIYLTTLFPQRPHHAPIMPKPEVSYKQKIFNSCRLSKHKLYVQENHISCMHCHASVSIHTKHACDFIASACIPQDKYVSYAIGNWHTHPSHHIIFYGGVLFCVKCGSTAMSTLINLKNYCNGCITPSR